jgi:peptide-methionine (R)-S-oxide reductase
MQTKKVVRTDKEWREILSAEQYRILRESGTERAFTGEYWNKTLAGEYRCAGCGTTLFTSSAKFISHCGWPAFDRDVGEGVVERITDRSHGMIRVEVRCGVCDSHLGHVFSDGPTETGERYCINSVAILHETEDAG